MLHIPSYNMGRAAGLTAKSLKAERPLTLDDVPVMDEILDMTVNLDLFFPSSYVEGYCSAWDYPDAKFAG
jgi:hypothetical protein